MQSFLGDAGKGGNALRQVTQREGVDNSLFRDRFAPQAGSSASQQAVRPSARSHSGQISDHPPQPFNLSHLSSALADPAFHGPASIPQHFEQSWNASRPLQPQSHQAPPRSARSSPAPGASGFVAEFQARPPMQSGWADSFTSTKGKGRAVEVAPASLPYQQYQPHPHGGVGYGGYQNMSQFQPSFAPMYSGYVQQPLQPPLQQSAPTQTVQQDQALDTAFDRAMADWKSMEDVHKGASRQEQPVTTQDGVEDRGDAKGELDKVWESLKPEAERLNKLAEWERDFSQFTNGEDDLFDTLNNGINDASTSQAPHEELFDHGPDLLNPLTDAALNGPLDEQGENTVQDPAQRNRVYAYTLPNRFDSIEPQDAWTMANDLLQKGASLTDATLLLESYLRRSTEMNRNEANPRQIEAWSLLGHTHAMNEKEEKALSAFEEGRRVLRGNEQSPHVGQLLTNLAISYVNESSDLEALQVLHQFLALVHPTHAGPRPSRESLESRSNPWAVHQEITDMYLNLAREQYNTNNQVDPDVQVGLGTLYYTMGDYTEARDCWTAALGERPDDYLLWNRLGATLANGGSPEEAVDAYRRALELKPLFTRATFNLGVACLNIGVHKEAAEHFLAALSLHAKDAETEQRDSTPIWLTLRRALIAMDLLELSGKARPGADLEQFRQAGFEF